MEDPAVEAEEAAVEVELEVVRRVPPLLPDHLAHLGQKAVQAAQEPAVVQGTLEPPGKADCKFKCTGSNLVLAPHHPSTLHTAVAGIMAVAQHQPTRQVGGHHLVSCLWAWG